MRMKNLASFLFLALFGATTVPVYLAARRGWGKIVKVTLVGAAANALLFFLYLVSQENAFLQALILGLLFGALFTGMTVTTAAFFRRNARSTRSASAPRPE
jgi:hypothetical protein